MKKFSLTALVTVLLLISTNAFAVHCPKEMKKIDEALAAKPQLSATDMSDVKKYRAEGETFHKAGKHQDALDTLEKAKKILKIQ